ncbi:MAG: NTP transferase domain-containing protein [Candidatus Bipolaricaulota bacterium]
MDCVILAAGKGTRMSSSIPKVLHEIQGRSLIEHLLYSIDPLELGKVVVVVGYGREKIEERLKNWEVEFTVQEKQKGTAHALQQAKGKIEDDSFLVFPGDLPLIKTSSIESFINSPGRDNHNLTLLTVNRDDPGGYGRIKRDTKGNLEEIVEEQDANKEERKIKEINTGIYLIPNTDYLWNQLDSINSSNAQGELYLTDLVKLFSRDGAEVSAKTFSSPEEFLGVNTRKDLIEAGQILNKRKINSLLSSGVTVKDPRTTTIETGVEIGRDTVVEPFTLLKGNTTIGENSQIGPNAEIINGTIGDEVKISHSLVRGSTIQDKTKVKPFRHLGPNQIVNST